MNAPVGAIFLFAGFFFLTVATVGILRFPDFFTRAHAMGKSETLGAILFLLGLAILSGANLTSFKLLLILVFIAIANPVATHALVRAALRSGFRPWVRLRQTTSSARPAEDGS